MQQTNRYATKIAAWYGVTMWRGRGFYYPFCLSSPELNPLITLALPM
ncbi:hypothetical protein EBME_0364 [bacterium endosymbiont of Mortierella elongata FMR23-6]|nr:hypothetical protein EBME_0364 [bacterium endosymbiont of Mortierella elongata FMR23-6]